MDRFAKYLFLFSVGLLCVAVYLGALGVVASWIVRPLRRRRARAAGTASGRAVDRAPTSDAQRRLPLRKPPWSR